MPLSMHGGNRADGGKGKYPLNTSQKKNFTHSVRQMNILQTPTRSIVSRYAVRQSFSQMGILLLPYYPCRRKRGKSFTFTFPDDTHSRKSENYMEAAGVQHGSYTQCLKDVA